VPSGFRVPPSSYNPRGAECALLPDSPDGDASAAAASGCQLDEAYREHRGALLGFLRRKTGAEEASDLVQEVFVRAAGSRQRGQLVNPGGFLRRIAQNLLIDRARHKRSNDILILPFEEDRDAACAPQQEWQLNADDLLGLYEQAVDAMPFKTRRVFLMHRVDELSYRDIHERLGISIATVEYHMMRALAHIAAALEIER
jgi:RNA polymerase sigma factor (sigma-70 family)